MSTIYTSRALVVCHRGTYLNSRHTGLIMDGAALVVSILDPEGVGEEGLDGLAGGTDAHIDTTTPWQWPTERAAAEKRLGVHKPRAREGPRPRASGVRKVGQNGVQNELVVAT